LAPPEDSGSDATRGFRRKTFSDEEENPQLRDLEGFAGGDGDRDLDIQERFAKPARASTGRERSVGFPEAGAAGLLGWSAAFCLAGSLGRISASGSTALMVGREEAGSHESGRSTIDLLLARVWPRGDADTQEGVWLAIG
jgi:hypothetical protein